VPECGFYPSKIVLAGIFKVYGSFFCHGQ
jgi:hypothetical protein